MIPHIPLGDWAEQGIEWLTAVGGGVFDAISAVMLVLVELPTDLLLILPSWAMIAVFAFIAWLVRSWQLAVGTVITFLLIVSMGQWDQAMETLAMILVATLFAIIIAVPVGIWAARNDAVSAAVRPVLDFMQTMPAFVYLIPGIFFFGIGVVPGVVSTIVFSLPPGVRMTELGIRQVDSETVEAGESFGATGGQILRGIQLPLALPTIMAGVNQIIMLALSMSVIAGIVGADGLGKEVVSSIATLNVAQGVEAGLSVVFLAIYLDRVTSALGDPSKHPEALLRRWQSGRRKEQEVVTAA